LTLTELVLRCAAALALTATPLAHAAADSPSTGPVIEKFGPVYDIPRPDFVTPTDLTYRAVFDVATSPEAVEQLNPRIESLARFLNMQARAGVNADHVKLALVVHGAAGKDMLSGAAYKTRFGVENPNAPLVAALKANGVRIVLCGQTAAHKGFGREELAPGVEIALSAMTALVALQSDGYELISF
jgi:intracellular sulfur oxidation DsrE/DsrF family protein